MGFSFQDPPRRYTPPPQLRVSRAAPAHPLYIMPQPNATQAQPMTPQGGAFNQTGHFIGQTSYPIKPMPTVSRFTPNGPDYKKVGNFGNLWATQYTRANYMALPIRNDYKKLPRL